MNELPNRVRSVKTWGAWCRNDATGDVTPAEWACAMAGEAGEACNVAKKIKRLETGTNTAKDPATMDACRTLMGKELADTVIYCDLLAASLGSISVMPSETNLMKCLSA